MIDFWAASDIHLHPSRPSRMEAFQAFLETARKHVSHLFIAGDLFDYWVGPPSLHASEYGPVLEMLEMAEPDSFHIYFLPGNRDFPAVLDLPKIPGVYAPGETFSLRRDSVRWLFLHGDTLCHHDTGYKFYRRLFAHPELVAYFRWLPDWLKMGVLKRFRSYSREKMSDLDQKKSKLTPYLMRARLYQNYHHVVCGHVHDPGRYRIKVDGRLRNVWVLGDWYREQNAYFLRCRGGSVSLDRWTG